ncbi:MAG: ABC transporter ATP-binding protein [Spirochaetota bacterium]|nr:ABC transporter ATP-binding protein [Spirochaetota bacterium]
MTLTINSISAGYDSSIILHDISVELKQGLVTALIGPNGSGKSTLLKVIAGIVKPYAGIIRLGDINVDELKGTQRAQLIAYLPQASNSLPSTTVFESILLGRKPYISFEPDSEDLAVVEDTIKIFNIEQYAFKKINELSGGEIQKVLIARAIAQRTKVLLLDEPINHLDVKNQLEIMNIVKHYTASSGLITMVVLHDINRALQFADEFILLKDGYIIERGSSEVITPHVLHEIYGIEADCITYKKKRKIIII